MIAIRDERPGDEAAIYDLTKTAFIGMPYSAGDEQDLIDALRADNALSVSLIAEYDGLMVGHIAFSRVTLTGVEDVWFDLGPVSVRPGHQGQGVGSALINAGIARLEALGAAGCVLLGYPEYYRRFGFAHVPTFTMAGTVNENFMQRTLRGETPVADVTYHPAFGVSPAE